MIPFYVHHHITIKCDFRECALVTRYFDSRGLSGMSSIGPVPIITLEAEADKVQVAMKSLSQRFGLKCSWGDFPSVDTGDWPILKSGAIEIKVVPLLQTFARDSYFTRAIKDLLKTKRIRLDDTVISYQYCIRPWFTSHFKYSETIQGLIALKSGQNPRTVFFGLDPD